MIYILIAFLYIIVVFVLPMIFGLGFDLDAMQTILPVVEVLVFPGKLIFSDNVDGSWLVVAHLMSIASWCLLGAIVMIGRKALKRL